MTPLTRSAAVLLLATASVQVACSRADLSGPPELRLGRDECGECGMLVSEDRSSAALLVEKRGRREYVMFDDIGCLLDYQRQNQGEFVELEAFVRDYGGGGWISAGDAWFLLADRHELVTPMGSGLAAFASEAAAQKAHTDYRGELMRLDSIGVAREQWLAAIFGRAPAR